MQRTSRSLPTIGIDGVNTGVSSTNNARLVLRGLAGNDHSSMPTMNGVFTNLYGGATVDGGDGDDVILTARAPDVLIGGPGADVLDDGAGDDRLFALDGTADTVRGGAGADAVERARGGAHPRRGPRHLQRRPRARRTMRPAT